MSLEAKRRIGEKRAAVLHHAAYIKELGWDPTFVKYNVPIKRSKTGNIPNDRLYRRRSHLIWKITTEGASFPNRIDFVMRAAELRYIEDELVNRGCLNGKTRHTLKENP